MTGSSALLTDFYQLTMGHAYFKLGMNDTAIFELFVRRLPRARRFLIAAGLEQVLQYLEGLRFERADIEYLSSLGMFPTDFLDRLATLRFSGNVHAMPEGTPFFANEPILRITAPILEAQLIESRVINLMHFQTLIASKAIRCVLAAGGRRLVDFGMRRAHGAEASLLASRAAYLAGFAATATTEAGRRFGIPLAGTMAHSFVEAHDREADAFRNFAEAGGGATSLLIDTYDTERAARRVVELARALRAAGSPARIQAVRIDSGDLAAQALAVRKLLDAHECQDIEIVVSGNLEEQRIAALLAVRAPVDAFGVGTSLDTSSDVPALDIAYKLQEYAGRARRKRSPGKQTWPGAKQVFRERDGSGRLRGDSIALADEACAGEPLLREVMSGGRRTVASPTLTQIRQLCNARVAELPAGLQELDEAVVVPDYPTQVSGRIQALAAQLDARGG